MPTAGGNSQARDGTLATAVTMPDPSPTRQPKNPPKEDLVIIKTIYEALIYNLCEKSEIPNMMYFIGVYSGQNVVVNGKLLLDELRVDQSKPPADLGWVAGHVMTLNSPLSLPKSN